MPHFWPFNLQYSLPNYHHRSHRKNHHNNNNDDDECSASSSSRSQSSLSSCLVTSPTKDISYDDQSTSSSSRRWNRHHRRHSSSSSSIAKPIKKSVSFYPQATQFDHIHVLDMTSEERANTWYNRHELNHISKENHETIQWMLRGFDSGDSSASNKVFCSRGMEYKTPMGIRLRMRHRLDSMEACLRFQMSEWNHGRDVDLEGMAEVYRRYTQHSVEVALLAAKMDREGVLAQEQQEHWQPSPSSLPEPREQEQEEEEQVPCCSPPPPLAQPLMAAA